MEKINFEDLPSTKTPIDSKNLNLLQTNVENAINGVIENGEGYIKFGDGTQICYGNIAFDIGTMTQRSQFWQYQDTDLSISFAKSFVSKPSVSGTVVAGNYASLLYVINCTNEKITQLNVLTLTNASNQRTNINYIAIGKWK